MLVKQNDLATMLGYTEAGVSLAVSRGKLIRRPDGYIDLKVEKNYTWLCNALSKQGREMPQEISALFKATPITENNNDKNIPPDANAQQGQEITGTADKEGLPVVDSKGATTSGLNESGGGSGDAPPPLDPDFKTLSEDKQQKISAGVSESERFSKHYRALEAKEKYHTAQINNEEKRGSLIKINPLGRFLEAIVEGSRNQVLNSLTPLVTMSLNNIKSALLDIDENGKRNIEDSQIILEETKQWQEALEKIFNNTDKDLVSRIRQMKTDIKSKEDNESNT